MNARGLICRALLIAIVLVPMTVGCTGGDGSDGGGVPVITPVYEWIVAFATEAGEWILKKATNFGDAVHRAWIAFWGPDKVNNVVLDEKNPLKGTYDGIVRCQVEWEKLGEKERRNKLEIQLDHPAMVRGSEASTNWELAPEEKERIEDLRDQLLGA